MDNLSGILNQHSFATTINHSGQLSGIKHFGQHGQLHLLESGTVRLNRPGQREILMDRPSVVLLPKGASHYLESIGDKPARKMEAKSTMNSARLLADLSGLR